MARNLRTYDQDLAAILHELESLGYVRRLAASAGSPEQWLLACDLQTLGLGPVFHRYALDPQNSLLQRPDLDLASWLAPAVSGEWLARGLATLAPVPAPAPVTANAPAPSGAVTPAG